MALTKPYDFQSLTLGQLVNALMDHRYTFEDVRNMTPAQLVAALEEVNDGRRKSWKQIEAEEKEKRKK